MIIKGEFVKDNGNLKGGGGGSSRQFKRRQHSTVGESGFMNESVTALYFIISTSSSVNIFIYVTSLVKRTNIVA